MNISCIFIVTDLSSPICRRRFIVADLPLPVRLHQFAVVILVNQVLNGDPSSNDKNSDILTITYMQVSISVQKVLQLTLLFTSYRLIFNITF